jgi:hypothetical protein
MKKFVCQYAIVRFLPYLETGEFANVGIVLLCPETGYFDFRLLNRARRITAFFEELKINLYRDAKNSFHKELERIQQFVGHANDDGKLTQRFVNNIFADLIRPREVMMRFDTVRTLLTDDPKQKLDELFSFYVERDFVTPVYQEKLIENNVRNVLRSADLISMYKKETIGDQAAYHATFPFVYMENGHARRVIKPINLAQDDPAQIFDHGWTWMGKIKKLRGMGLLHDDVLLAVKSPRLEDKPEFDMYNEIVKTLKSENIIVAQANDKDKILQFAIH